MGSSAVAYHRREHPNLTHPWPRPRRARPLPRSLLEEPDLTASTPEPAAPAASDDAVARVGKFLFTVAHSDKPPDDKARVRALTAWLLTNWKSDLEGEKNDASSASSHCSVL